MKFLNKLLQSKIFNTSLRIKITVIFILPVIATMSLLSYFHVQNERTELQSLTEANAIQVSDTLLASMSHAMMMNDTAMLGAVLGDIKESSSIKTISIITPDTDVYASTDPSETGKKYKLNQPGCIECHGFPPANRPHSTRLTLDNSILRVATIINNDTECQICHSSTQPHLGVLLIDSSLAQSEQYLRKDTIFSIGISAASIVIVIILGYFMIQWLIVRRVDVIRLGLMNLGMQDFSTRITKNWHTQDELTQLGDYFNQIAANLEILKSESDKKERARALAIIEERERIARELHDGVAQFLGYLSAKVGAIRLALKNGKTEVADGHLEQVEQSIHTQSIEVRSAIIGLKMAGNVDRGLAKNVREFVEQCNRLDELWLELEISSAVEDLNLGTEKELQLLRILQEAVSNVRKHSMATEVSIRLEKKLNQAMLTITDNGVGFDPVQTGLARVGHFGLQIMFERAYEIGAHIEIKSTPGHGTQVIVAIDI